MEVKTTIDPNMLRGARWFAGKSRAIARLSEGESFAVAGGRLVFLDVEYASGGAERYLVADGKAENFWSGVVDALVAGPVAGLSGRLELRRGTAFEALAPGPGATERVPSTDQSNTLVALGERLLLKAYRRLEPGVHPEVELLGALGGTSAPVPAHAGSVHHIAADGEETAVMLLQELVPDAESGWEAAILRVAALLRDGGDVDAAAVEFAEAGRVAAALHRALASASGVAPATPGAGAKLRRAAEAVFDEAFALDSEVAQSAADVRARLAALERADGVAVGRVHGDLHYAQYLRAPGRLLVVDFEGDPTASLAARRAPATPLHDLACLLRSIDHIGSAAARRVGGDPSAWVAAATDAARGAYEDEAGARVDRALLAALEVAKEGQELVYAHRVLPEWAYAPRLGLRRLLQRGEP
jgi:maltokinase